VERHIRILGVIYIALGALGILAALLLFVGFTGKGPLSENTEPAVCVRSANQLLIKGLMTRTPLRLTFFPQTGKS